MGRTSSGLTVVLNNEIRWALEELRLLRLEVRNCGRGMRLGGLRISLPAKEYFRVRRLGGSGVPKPIAVSLTSDEGGIFVPAKGTELLDEFDEDN